MSLSRILNNDPLPVHSSRIQPHIDHSPSYNLSPSSPSSPTLRRDQSYPSHRAPDAYDSWESQHMDWPKKLGTHALSDHRRHYSKHGLGDSSDDSPELINHERDGETSQRKKRKGAHEDSDYQPSGSKRKGRSRRRMSSIITGFANDLDSKKSEYHSQPLSQEERRLASSDLEDCQDVWAEELSDYILETKKRQNQVAQYFWASILERNSITAQNLSHHYATKIANIAPAPSPPPPHHHSAPENNIYPPVEHENYNGNYIAESSVHSRDDRGFSTSAEDAALEFERSVLGEDLPPPSVPLTKRKGKAKESKKRPVPEPEYHSGSEAETSSKRAEIPPPPKKKRKLEKDAVSVAEAVERSLIGEEEYSTPKPSAVFKGKGKAKQVLQQQIRREQSHDSISTTPKPPRKKPGPKKKVPLALEAENEFGSVSHPPSVAGDVTPAISRPNSPIPANMSIVYDFEEPIPPLKKAKKIDDVAMLKRIKTLEEAQRKVWTNIARRDVAKVYKYHALGYQTRQSQLERIAKLASIQARKPFIKTAKANKDTQAKAKRLMREMQVFWKKNEKEERDVRRREQKEAMDRLKIEEEKREAARQARKLEFLISQTELYSHFVGNKLKTTEIEGDNQALPTPAGANVGDVDPEALPEINFDDEDHTNLHRHARANAQEAVALAKQRAQQFDTQAALERKTNEALKLAKAQAHIREDNESLGGSENAPLVDLDSDELNFQNPTSLSGPLTIGQPKMLMATLKEYQLKGLNWLATLYEQGINGILADEMGLGKTVQSISLLAYLAETHDIWGPFLVVAPASTLHNWQQELTRFVPNLKALPYWGNVKDRATLRKFWSKKEISYDQDAPFHVLITSYQLVTQDQQYFQRVKWQYMILDEAQNIKNSSSVRWKTLLGFQCRNRLLLTGTPIQNSMQELWALLHFIMPSLFDSHDEFNEWFSKDIENAAENKGSKLNEHQLRRLHMILKPFMLRRVKRHVQNELSEKIEIDIFVDLSARQRALYTALLAKVSVADLLEKAANIGDADSARSLMNIVMQFRKVCNHPELFERADVVSPFSFCMFGRPGSLMREGDFVSLPYSTRNPIEYVVPELLYHGGGLLDVPLEDVNVPIHTSVTTKLFNIWSTDWIHRSIYEECSSAFSFLRLIGLSPQEVHSLHISPLFRRRLLELGEEIRATELAPYLYPDFAPCSVFNTFRVLPRTPLTLLDIAEGLPALPHISISAWNQSYLSKSEMKWYIPSVVAPPISLYCVDRTFNDRQSNLREAPLESLMLYGLPEHLLDSTGACMAYHSLIPAIPPIGLVNISPSSQLPSAPMQVPEAKRLIYDSAKLARLDALLQELKTGDHRVLVYFQMTRMMDLMEEYLIYRQYKYLRLDGSSKLEDRRDMVIDWQTRPDIFVFLLSTRAGGLGINLTAADTVVFYDHDWNPSNDAQAMDRAHRLGQTRQVTVYRLITKGTIDERIIQLARVKKDVQDIVVGNKNFTDVTKPSEIVQLLLNDEQLASLDQSGGLTAQTNERGKHAETGKKDGDNMRDLWNEEGDDFFGHSGSTSNGTHGEKGDEDTGTPIGPTIQKKKRKSTGTGAPRGRKPTKKKAETGATAAELTKV